eukprot:CAMPEP_0179067600 /NCGR_PEP_ID=MMETSP0796-20121207/29570_1 /TAXON_ID=73915 /ORGANISM="Pyrodinium bahamense, Strain pbaha01" /LENGTH=348 /DNA_ID=CAMNT_0020764629 /DNA_START=73 /DNA_END=1117 /DNA_ORIENTATION=-
MMFQPPVRPVGNVIVEFRAGRMDWDGRLVTPDKRKGKIVLYTSDEDQLIHFQWFDREKNEAVLDLIVVGDAYLEREEKCKTGRVYVLRFTSSDKKLFFWMQEPKEDGDADLVKRFNEAIGAKIPEKDKEKEKGAAAAPGAGTAAAAPPGGAAAQGELRAILQQFLDSQGAQGQRTPPVPLSAVLTTEVLQSLLTDEAACAEMTALLPETHQSPEGLRQALASPQLQQSINALSQAVHSDQLPVLLASLGLDPSVVGSAAPGSDALDVLCRAMEAQSGGTDTAVAKPTSGAGGGDAGGTSGGDGSDAKKDSDGDATMGSGEGPLVAPCARYQASSGGGTDRGCEWIMRE